MIEINDIGQEIVDLLWNDLEYEDRHNHCACRKGQVMDAGFSKHDRQYGRESKSEVLMCHSEEMVEQDKMVLNDFNVVELASFVSKWDRLRRKRTP